MDEILINKTMVEQLIGYVDTLLDFVDVEGFESEDNKNIVNDGYDAFVTPVVKEIDNGDVKVKSELTDDEIELIKKALNHYGDRLADTQGYNTGEKCWDLVNKF